jgi:hypothetical protein
MGGKPDMVMVTVVDARPRGSNWKVPGVEEMVECFRHVSLEAEQSLSAEGRANAVPKGQVPPKGVAVDSGGLVSMVSETTVLETDTQA